MVTTLNLEVLPRPKPYQIAWFEKGGEVEVVKLSLVSFSFGKKKKTLFFLSKIKDIWIMKKVQDTNKGEYKILI